MKHLIKSALILLSLSLSETLSAYDFKADGIYYNINGNEATVTCQYEYSESDFIYGYSDYKGHVIIPNTVTYNGTNYPVTTIDNWAFGHCNELTSIDIANSITSIGDCAFMYSGLNHIEIPNSITYIGAQAFCCCENLTSITIPNSITQINFGTFTACHNLTNITIPSSVSVIDDHAFHECTGLTRIDLPNSVTTIGSNVFLGCSSLKEIIIPKSVTSIGQIIFNSCWGLESIHVEDGNPNYDSRDNCNAIIESASNTLIAGCKKTKIPNTITSIGYGAFLYCTGLTSINIPNSVNHIGYGAFYECNSLTNVYSYNVNPEKVFLDDSVFALSDESLSYSNRTLHVPIGTLAAYQADSRWSEYFGLIVEMEPTPFIRGDVDGDGRLTISDVTALIDILLSGDN